MTPHRTIISTALLLLAISVVLPAAALANPLLSGYGGPGQGSQAILGSTLLNGPGSGGGAPPLSAAQTPAGLSAGVGAPAGGQLGSRTGSAQRGSAGHAEEAQPTHGAAAAGTDIYPASERQIARASGTLGLTGWDVAYILLAFGLLVLTALITRRLTLKTAAGPRG